MVALALPSTQERLARPQSRWQPFLRNGRVVFGASILLIIVLLAILAPVLAPFEVREQDPSIGNEPPFFRDDDGALHIFGTDSLGRDIYSRVLFGARVSLLVGGAAVAVALLIGVPLGLLSGFLGGRVDSVIMRLVDIQLAIPFFLLAISIAALFGQGLWNVIFLLGVTSWFGFARVVRAQVLAIRELPYVEAARSIGVPPGLILLRHLLPNAWTPILVLASQQVGSMIVAESSLTFLGIGVPPDTATWGGMIAAGRSYLEIAWWITTIPGIALTVTVVAVYFLGDGLRDVLDPKTKT